MFQKTHQLLETATATRDALIPSLCASYLSYERTNVRTQPTSATLTATQPRQLPSTFSPLSRIRFPVFIPCICRHLPAPGPVRARLKNGANRPDLPPFSIPRSSTPGPSPNPKPASHSSPSPTSINRFFPPMSPTCSFDSTAYANPSPGRCCADRSSDESRDPENAPVDDVSILFVEYRIPVSYAGIFSMGKES